jgi:hypothetical protein
MEEIHTSQESGIGREEEIALHAHDTQNPETAKKTIQPSIVEDRWRRSRIHQGFRT